MIRALVCYLVVRAAWAMAVLAKYVIRWLVGLEKSTMVGLAVWDLDSAARNLKRWL